MGEGERKSLATTSELKALQKMNLEFFLPREDRWIQLWERARVTVLMHFTHNQTDILGLSGLGCRPGADRSLTFAARIQAIPAEIVTPELNRIRNPTRPKNPSRERKRAVSIALATLPLSVRIPRTNIAAL